MIGAVGRFIVKLVPAVRALTVPCTAVVLHVTPSFVPRDESNVRSTWLLAVIAVVLTTSVVAEAATVTLPADAEAHAAGDALDEQLVCVL
jgi:hypothetical protein